MPIQGNTAAQGQGTSTTTQDGTDSTSYFANTPSNFMQMIMQMPNFEGWLQTMLKNLGYGVFAPGEAQPAAAQANGLSAAAKGNVDPYGANWSPGMQAPATPALGPPKVEAWKPPQAKPPENTQASF